MATPPRIVTPNRSVHLIIRAVSRQHRFTPTPEVTASIEYIFWHYAAVHGIAVHEMTWMSNHAHCILTDVRGVLPRFVCQVNSLISRQLNALRYGTGANIEKGYCDIDILDDETMLGYCAYTLANPCRANLVAKASSWRGVTTYNLEYGKSFEIHRPVCGLWANHGIKRYASNGRLKKKSKLPDIVHGCLARPQIFPKLSDRELRSQVRRETKIFEDRAQHARQELGQRVLGWRQVLKSAWNDSPMRVESISRRKRFATRCLDTERLHIDRVCLFNQRHEEARLAFLEQQDDPVPFPYGTWLMKDSFRRACESSPPLLET